MKRKYLTLSITALAAASLTVGTVVALGKKANKTDIEFGEIVTESKLPSLLMKEAPENKGTALTSPMFLQVSDEYEKSGANYRSIRFGEAFKTEDFSVDGVFDMEAHWTIKTFDSVDLNKVISIENAKSENAYQKIEYVHEKQNKELLPSDLGDYNAFVTYTVRDIPVELYQSRIFMASTEIVGLQNNAGKEESTTSDDITVVNDDTIEAALIVRQAVTTYRFTDSYKVDGKWVHEISSAEELGKIVTLGAEQGGGDKDTTYLLTKDISFGNQTAWTGMGVSASDWENYVFTGKLVGDNSTKVISDIKYTYDDDNSLTSTELVGGLFCKIRTSDFENLEFDNINVETKKAAVGIVVGGNEVAAALRHQDTIEMNNITINESCSLIGGKNCGAFAGNVRYFDSLKTKNYINRANVTCTHYGAAGLAGTATGLRELYVENSANFGNMSADQGRAAGFIGAISGVGTETNQTVAGGFTFINCQSNGIYLDNNPKDGQCGGFFVGLQNATDVNAFSANCASCSIGGTLRTTRLTGYTYLAEKEYTWIEEHDVFNTHVEQFSLASLNTQIDVVNHTISIDTPAGVNAAYYTLNIVVDCQKCIADFDTQTCYQLESKIMTIYQSKHYSSEVELETNERMLSRMGYFMPTLGGKTITKGTPDKYNDPTRCKLQEFAISEENRGKDGFREQLSKEADGTYRLVLLNEVCNESNGYSFIGLSRMGTRVHYVVSAYDASDNKVAGSEFTQMIYNGTDENVHSILAIDGSYTFYRNYQW